MAIRDLVSVDGRPACEVDTAEELTQVLIPGVWVRGPRAVLDACGLTEQENTDDERIAVEADQRDDAWIAHGGESDMPDDPTATAYHTAFAGKVAALLRAGIAPWQTPWTPGRVRVPVTRITTRRTPAPPSTKE